MQTSSSLYDYDDNNDNRLEQKFKSLEKDWDSFKQSKPRLRRHRSSSNVKSTMNMLELLDKSPRKLMFSLQHPQKRFSLSSPFDGKEEWKVRDNELAVLEIMRERMEAIESGQLKGRNLLEALENAAAAASDDDGGLSGGGEGGGGGGGGGYYYKEDMICSACSSVLIHGSEVTTSLGSSYSSSPSPSSSSGAAKDDNDDDDGDGDDRDVGRFGDSSSLNVIEKKKKKKMEEEDRDVCVDGTSGSAASVCGCRDGGGGKGMVVMAWVAVFLMMFALGIILLKSFEDGGCDEDGFQMLKPT